MDDAAILIAPHGAAGPLRGIVDRLAAAGVTTTIVDELAAAVDVYASAEAATVLLDLRDASDGEYEDPKLAYEAIRRVIDALPDAAPVPIFEAATPALLVACLRAGAGDVIDLSLEGTGSARQIVQRLCDQQRTRAADRSREAEQREMIEDLLKDLIRTERRSIDAEDRLAAKARASAEHALDELRAPAVLLVEHDRDIADELADLLEAAGVATFAYVAGEEAVREAETLATTTGLDLALVAAQLPGIDGLETIRRLRERISALPAFLMTKIVDADLAANAADLGVVGFVQKPLADLDDVVGRLAALARESLQRTREHSYVERIKERHERVLARYRQLPREA